jgi:hypothetical protein
MHTHIWVGYPIILSFDLKKSSKHQLIYNKRHANNRYRGPTQNRFHNLVCYEIKNFSSLGTTVHRDKMLLIFTPSIFISLKWKYVIIMLEKKYTIQYIHTYMLYYVPYIKVFNICCRNWKTCVLYRNLCYRPTIDNEEIHAKIIN